MKDHRQKLEDLYPTMAPQNKIICPTISLPMACLEGKECQPGDTCIIEVTVKIVSMDEDTINCDLLESEYETAAQEAKEAEK